MIRTLIDALPTAPPSPTWVQRVGEEASQTSFRPRNLSSPGEGDLAGLGWVCRIGMRGAFVVRFGVLAFGLVRAGCGGGLQIYRLRIGRAGRWAGQPRTLLSGVH